MYPVLVMQLSPDPENLLVHLVDAPFSLVTLNVPLIISLSANLQPFSAVIALSNT